MDQKQAIGVLIEAVQIANKAGAYDLMSSKNIAIAVEAIVQRQILETKQETAAE